MVLWLSDNFSIILEPFGMAVQQSQDGRTAQMNGNDLEEIDQSLVFWTDRLSCHLQLFVSLRLVLQFQFDEDLQGVTNGTKERLQHC